MIDLYVDAEWYIGQELFLIGYAYASDKARKNPIKTGQLYSQSLNKRSFVKLLDSVTGHIFFYGPDIGMLEKAFDIDIRNKYKCVNLLKIFRLAHPGRSSYKLASFEEDYGVRRHEDKYKRSIFRIWDDWNNPTFRLRVLKYNVDDVRNLVTLKEIVFAEKGITNEMLKPHYLLPNKKKVSKKNIALSLV